MELSLSRLEVSSIRNGEDGVSHIYLVNLRPRGGNFGIITVGGVSNIQA